MYPSFHLNSTFFIEQFIPKQRSIMKKVMILVMVMLMLSCVNTVSAIDYPYTWDIGFIQSNDYNYEPIAEGGIVYSLGEPNYLRVCNIEKVGKIDILFCGQAPLSTVSNPAANPSGAYPVTLTPGNITGTLYYNVHYVNGNPSWVNIWIEFDDWDYPGAGNVLFKINMPEDCPITIEATDTHSTINVYGETANGGWAAFGSYYSTKGVFEVLSRDYILITKTEFTHTVIIDELEDRYRIDIYRHDDFSTIRIYDNSYTYLHTDYTNTDKTLDVFKYTLNPDLTINITDPYENFYERVLVGEVIEEPTLPSNNASITVYVKNSQNGALIANSHIDISAFVNGEFHDVVNETLPGGIYTGNLQPTGGGLPNPDYYRLIATAEGYNSIMPYIDFEVDGETTIYAILDPIGGAPEDENNTFIDFYVRDINANPISGATVNFGGYTLITNSAGYTIFEVEKNNAYTWVVSKSGYGALIGNVVIGSDGRYTINTVIAPAVTPTTTTPIPTQTHITPTPTMTTPTGEPVSNWLEWFAAHFGMILGGGVEIGKIFMWLCFTVPVGVYVGKESKAGAAGFMAGAGIVTLFFVLIGWVPIWLVVLLALIIGLLYAKVFNTPDNGGGR